MLRIVIGISTYQKLMGPLKLFINNYLAINCYIIIIFGKAYSIPLIKVYKFQELVEFVLSPLPTFMSFNAIVITIINFNFC